MDAIKPEKKKRKSLDNTTNDVSSIYSVNQFSALRSLKRVRRPAGSPLVSIGNPGLLGQSLPATIQSTGTYSSPPNDESQSPQVSASQINSVPTGSPERKRKYVKEEKRPDKPDINAISTFKPSPQNTASHKSGLCLVALQPGETICFQGAVLAAPVSGAFTILGYEAIADPAWAMIANQNGAQTNPPPPLGFLPCYSPKSHSLLVIHASFADVRSSASSNPPQGCLADPTASEHIIKLLRQLKSRQNKIIVALRSMSFTNVSGIEEASPLCKCLFNFEKAQIDAFNIPGWCPILSPIPGVAALSIPNQWEDAASTIASDTSERTVIVIAGSKNTGKSTLSRYITNRLLNSVKRVAFLECDIGQSEFTPAALVSLNVITSPILGPPFTHQQMPSRSLYYGATSPNDDPDFYLACLQELYDTYVAELSRGPDGESVPLVINTHGWIKGMGLDLLIHFLSHAQPTHVIQLSVPSFSPQSSMKNIQVDLGTVLSDMTKGQYNPHTLQVTAQDTSSTRVKFGAGDHRMLGILSYFHRVVAPLGTTTNLARSLRWTFDEPLTTRTPYEVPFNRIRIKFVHGEVPFSQTLQALNGAVVGLVIDETQYDTPSGRSDDVTVANDDDDEVLEAERGRSLRIVPSQVTLLPHMHHCVGLGLVRGIDVTNEAFHIVTGPIPADQLRKVNTFVRGGGMEIPSRLLVAGYENTRAHLPYTTHFAAEGIGSVAWRTRHNLLRKRAPKQREF